MDGRPPRRSTTGGGGRKGFLTGWRRQEVGLLNLEFRPQKLITWSSNFFVVLLLRDLVVVAVAANHSVRSGRLGSGQPCLLAFLYLCPSEFLDQANVSVGLNIVSANASKKFIRTYLSSTKLTKNTTYQVNGGFTSPRY